MTVGEALRLENRESSSCRVQHSSYQAIYSKKGRSGEFLSLLGNVVKFMSSEQATGIETAGRIVEGLELQLLV